MRLSTTGTLAAAFVIAIPLAAGRATAQPVPVCGNGVLEPPETCDDGNLLPGDGCSPLCQLENLPPDCSRATPSVAEPWPPNHRLVPVSIEGVTDPDGDPVAISITAVAQDEPLAGEGDGNTCPDAIGVGTPAASVRAERSGQGDGRVYHVSFSASDGRGGVCLGAVEVCVRHDQRPGGVCGDGGPLVDSTAGGAPPCDAGTCEPEDCVPSPRDVHACDDDNLPPGVERQLSSAHDLLGRAARAHGRGKARRLGRKAARHLEQAAAGAARAADHDHLSGGCAADMAERLTEAVSCATCDAP